MKICTSYFYQVRNFTPDVIPVSVASYAPDWFHASGAGMYTDKNGVLNGFVYYPLRPNSKCHGLCKGHTSCTSQPDECTYMQEYRKQLGSVDFNRFLSDMQRVATEVSKFLDLEKEPTVALMVHESPHNPCSERVLLQEWCSAHGVPIEEWVKE